MRKGIEVRVLLVGGGSGGHITPLLAVANQLIKDDSSTQVHIATERFGKFSDLFVDNPGGYTLHRIFAGKLRRYHGESWLRRLTDIKTILLNIRDGILLAIGTIEAVYLLARLRPKVVFIKGGYVGLPLGLACRVFRIPYITHDSDASPGLTNRLIGGGAKLNAVGMKNGAYSYSPDKTVYVGVPVESEYKEKTLNKDSRQKLGLKPDDRLILVLGGSNGAQRLDRIMYKSLRRLLSENKNIRLIHQVGKDNENIYTDYPSELKERITAARFLSPLVNFSSAADIIISRAGATAIAEFAALGKPIILVPHPELTGGHQVSNANALDESDAACVVEEAAATKNPSLMTEAISQLLKSKKIREKISKNLHNFMDADATERISKLLLSEAEGKHRA